MQNPVSVQRGPVRTDQSRPGPARRLCVAPMMDWTDRHFRSLARMLAPDALLYTEMVVDAAIEHGNRDRLLGFDARELPVALQLGGCTPAMLARAASVGEQYGYSEINLNIGCPSGRVQAGRFGACLMAEPMLVAECVSAIRGVVSVPVTVKTRIGIDEHDSYEFLERFALAVTEAGVDALIVHARKAWLAGLSPKQNREIPQLDYARVARLREALPSTPVIVNGGINEVSQAASLLEHFDGVMIGRCAYRNPMRFAQMSKLLYPQRPVIDSAEALRQFLPYIEKQLECGVRLHSITRHMSGLFQGQPGARRWRQGLSRIGDDSDRGLQFLKSFLAEAASAA